jgi:hypothetical protein
MQVASATEGDMNTNGSRPGASKRERGRRPRSAVTRAAGCLSMAIQTPLGRAALRMSSRAM